MPCHCAKDCLYITTEQHGDLRKVVNNLNVEEEKDNDSLEGVNCLQESGEKAVCKALYLNKIYMDSCAKFHSTFIE